jgi:hypothetical protein
MVIWFLYKLSGLPQLSKNTDTVVKQSDSAGPRMAIVEWHGWNYALGLVPGHEDLGGSDEKET